MIERRDDERSRADGGFERPGFRLSDLALLAGCPVPDQDPLKLSFPKLHRMVCELEDFDDAPDASNERILENIQMAWYEEKQ